MRTSLPTGQNQLLQSAGKAWGSPSEPSRRTTKGRASPAVCPWPQSFWGALPPTPSQEYNGKSLGDVESQGMHRPEPKPSAEAVK